VALMEVDEDQLANSADGNTIEGYLEAIVDDVLIGWAWSPQRPDLRLSVTIAIDEQRCGELVADQLSSKLAEAGIGDGGYSFRLRLPAEFLDGRAHELAVSVEGSPLTPRRPSYEGSNGTKFVVVRSFSVPLARRPLRTRGIDGLVEAVVGDQIIGWAWSSDAPDERVEVEILLDGKLLGTTVAKSPREDLHEAGIGDGAHGFSYRLPDTAGMGAEQIIEARAGAARLPLDVSVRYRLVDTPSERRLRSVRYSALSSSDPPAPQKAVVTNLNWLFGLYASQSAGTIGEAIDLRVQRYEHICETLGELGIPYLLAIAPEKQDVYPELADGAQSIHAEFVQRLRAAVRDSRWPQPLDLAEPLIDARRHGVLYPRTDSKWNARGAFFAARAIVKAISSRVEGVTPLGLERARGLRCEGFRGDLVDLPKVGASSERPGADAWVEATVEADATSLRSVQMPAPEHLVRPGYSPPLLFELADEPNLPRLALMGGATVEPILPWFAEQSRRTVVFQGHDPPLEPIELEAPDALVHLVTAMELVAVDA
jgi:hypothetical protein